MEQIQKFIECLIPVTACNLKCSYCYVIQEDRRKLKIPELEYDLDTIQYALRKERWGGACYFSICGAGETMLPPYMVDLVVRILSNGHYVNVTTNGTLTNRFDELLEKLSEEERMRMHFAFSLHYIELRRLKLLDTFFANVKKVHEAGCSFVVQLNMCDEYVPLIEEIKDRCSKEIGAFPQIAVTRKEDGYPVKKIDLHTEGTREAYIKNGREFDSPLFEYTLQNFLQPRREFCYAGAWSYQLNLQTGLMKRCYCSCVVQNTFKHPDQPIRELAVGHFCNSEYCFNSSHFLSQGVIPELPGPTYAQLRDRPEAEWYNPCMRQILDHKLGEVNKPHGPAKRILSFIIGVADRAAYKLYEFLLKRKLNRGNK